MNNRLADWKTDWNRLYGMLAVTKDEETLRKAVPQWKLVEQLQGESRKR